MRLSIGLMLVGLLVMATAATAAQQTTIEDELDGAKALYQDGRLNEAIGSLRAVIVKLNAVADQQGRTSRLAEAHLHLGLAYLAMRDESTALENFRQVAAFDPDRVLDPDIYAPRVITVFERARSEVVRPLPPGRPDAPPPAAGPVRKDSGVTALNLDTPLLRVVPGTKLRVGRQGTPFGVEGRMFSVSETVLTIGNEGWRLDIPRDTVTRVEIVSHRKNHWIIGALIGGGLGVLIGASETPGCDAGGTCYTRAENIAYGGVGFGLIGGVIGYFIKTDQWSQVPLDHVRNRPPKRAPMVGLTW